MGHSNGAGCGFWIRVAAYLLDQFIFNLLLVACVLVAGPFVSGGSFATVSSGDDPRVGVGYLGFILLYRVCFEASSLQGTPGKHFVGLKIVTTDGAQISPFRALARNVVRYVTFSITFGIGFLIVLLPGRKRALHDMLSGTLVVKV
jgi:uncharacterized RDD family membrane protein YckC